MQQNKNKLTTKYRRWSFIVPPLLVVSLLCNLAALTLPFIEIDKLFSKPIIYNLPHSVMLMWTHQLYFICALIIFFSILFPFIKLIAIACAWFRPWHPIRRIRFLQIIELLGKWSYIDIFIVILLLVLTDRQIFIVSKIHIGLDLFICAITLSMLASQIVLALANKHSTARQSRAAKPAPWRKLRQKTALRWAMPSLLLVSAIALIAAIDLPFLRINQFFMESHTYSIKLACAALTANKQWLLSAIMISFVAAAPLLRLIILAAACCLPIKYATYCRITNIATTLSRWSMLDVFGLSLFLIITEGRLLIKTEIQTGLYFVVTAIALSYLLAIIANRLQQALARSAIK